MTERLLLAAALLALSLAAVAVGRWWYAQRNTRIEERLRRSSSAGTLGLDSSDPVGRPRIVYFTTKTCAVCRAQQEPALASLVAHDASVLVERHDAVEERELADQYGVLSVPTTAVYDEHGVLVTINRGFAPAALLLAQARGEAAPAFEGGIAMPSEPISDSLR